VNRYQLTPVLAANVEHFLHSCSEIAWLADTFGSPVNLLFPESITNNVKGFFDVFERYALQGNVYYAHKPNKSQALVKQAYASGMHIDVASKEELLDALEAGFSGAMIGATGPKNKAFLLLAIQQRCCICVDNMDELQLIARFAQMLQVKEPVPLLIRLTGFHSGTQHVLARDSRFGIHLRYYDEIFTACTDPHLDLKGFAFHLDTTSESEKITAIENMLHLLLQAQERGFAPSILDIGGGFKVNYLASQNEWHAYTTALKRSIAGEIPSITWNNTGYGFKSVDGQIRGAPTYYEYYNQIVGHAFLERILCAPLPDFEQRTVAQILNDLMVELWIEPGRALLDQCGLTLAKVMFVKQSAQGEWLVGLDMNKSHLSSVEDEMFCDPLVISRSDGQEHRYLPAQGVYFVGNLCQEHDVIYRHKTFLPRLPSTDDLVIFVNTAAYHMDFNESESIKHPIAKKLIVVPRDETTFSFYEDHTYHPLLAR
jgi:diaminopimelate decarboxylase